MVIQDDRTAAEKVSHPFLVIATDTFLSGWGRAEGGMSYAAWACTEKDAPIVMQWVRRRSDMKKIRLYCGKWYPTGKGHAHIYVVHDDHPSLAR